MPRDMRTRPKPRKVKKIKGDRMCYVILETEKDEHDEYIPCIVKEGETGYFLTSWSWGKDIELARKIADQRNAEMGISKEEAYTLTLESMRKTDV